MLAGVIFDMDGVLIDSHPVHRQAWRRFLATVGQEVDDKHLEFILEGRRREDILRYFLGELPEATLAEYGQRKEQFFQENFSNVSLIPGIQAFLDLLETSGFKLGLATSASSYRTFRTLEVLNLKSKFIAVTTGDDVPAGKPDPFVYNLTAERMSLKAAEILVLEDAPCGVQAAKRAGMRCIGVSSNGRAQALKRAGADDVIPDFQELSLRELHRLWEQIELAHS